MYLLAEDGAVLAESFYRPPAGGSKQRFADDFVLDGEVEFESGFLVEVGDVVWEGTTVSPSRCRVGQRRDVRELTSSPSFAESHGHQDGDQGSSFESCRGGPRVGSI